MYNTPTLKYQLYCLKNTVKLKQNKLLCCISNLRQKVRKKKPRTELREVLLFNC